MFRQLTKLVQPTRVSPLNEPAPNAAAGEGFGRDGFGRDGFRREPIQAKQPVVDQQPRRLQQVDLSLSFNLLHQAIKRFADLKPNAGLALVDPRLIEELRKRILAYESERLRLRSDLEYAQHCAHSYWERCKSVEAELDQLRGGLLNNSTSGSKRGVL